MTLPSTEAITLVMFDLETTDLGEFSKFIFFHFKIFLNYRYFLLLMIYYSTRKTDVPQCEIAAVGSYLFLGFSTS